MEPILKRNEPGASSMNRPPARRHPSWLPLLVVATSLLPPYTRADEAPQITFEAAADRLQIRIGGEPLAIYVYRDETVRRPYFAHVHAPGGIPITRAFPPVAGTDPTDHATMHPGLWLAFGDINGVDFWRNKGLVEHDGFIEPPSGGPGRATFTVQNRYLPRPGAEPVCLEACQVTILARPAGTMLVLDSKFVSPTHEVAFGAQEEMGLGVRVATPIAVKQGGRLEGGNGLIGERQIWGKHAPWCDASGTIAGRHAGITLMPDPATFEHGWFHVRDYGLMVANPIERSTKPKGEPAKLVVGRGMPLRLRFGVWLHAEPAGSAPDLKSAYEDFLRTIPTLGRRTP
jgi:hypothetical protein